MRLLRSILFTLLLALLTPPYAIACLLAFPFMRAPRRYAMAIAWCKAVVRLARMVCGLRYRIEGLDNLPPGPVVLLSKHQSAWETIAFPALLPRRLCFVFKRELLFVPFFGWALGMLSMIHIDRRSGPRAFVSVVRQGRERLAEGWSVIMFPEGTRTAPGAQGRYKTGGARFAHSTQAAVVPIAHNAGHLWPRNSLTKYAGLITVSIGPAIDTAGLGAEQINERVQTWIEAEMRRIDPKAYPDASGAGGASGQKVIEKVAS